MLMMLVVLAAFSPCLRSQERFFVNANDGSLGLYDLASNTFVEGLRSGLGNDLIPGPNNRLVFSVGYNWVSVVDLTIARETKRLSMVGGELGNYGALSADGKLLLIANADSGLLTFIDAAQLTVVRKLNVASAMGAPPGQVVAGPNKAYILPQSTEGTAKIAVVDLSNYSITTIPLPDSLFSYGRPAAVTADLGTLIVLELKTDFTYHILLISTASDRIIRDTLMNVQAFDIVTSSADPNYAYALGFGTPNGVALPLDLRTNSPTYGQFLTADAVSLGTGFSSTDVAISSDASRLVVAGSTSKTPGPNVNVIDLAKMFTDPAHALISQPTLNGGVFVRAVCAGPFSTTPPNTAPVVTGVSGDITNDVAHQVEITGGNFQQGAEVRIGSMDLLAATVNGSTTLNVTVPANAAAGKAIDIVVTNPMTQGPPGQQNQSGLLAGGFNVALNPKYQPGTQFATDNGDQSISIYNLVQRATVNVDIPPDYLMWPAFNVDGRELYLANSSIYNGNQVLPLALSNNQAAAPIPFGKVTFLAAQQTQVSALDPVGGKPVVYLPVGVCSGDLWINVIDSDPLSQTFNTVINTYAAGLDPDQC